MTFRITREEANRAKQEGMTAYLLRAELFTTAIDELNSYTASMAGAFNGINFSQRIFLRESVEAAINWRSVSILKETGIIAVCASGYVIEPNNIPHDEVRKMCEALEMFYFEVA